MNACLHTAKVQVCFVPVSLFLVFSLQLFALLGFVVSAVVISAAASEVVSLLHMLGVVLSLSNTVLGLTLLAWGNSIGGKAIV